MAIAGSTALASKAIPAATSPQPYAIYQVTNTTGIQLYGFILTNTGGVPVNWTIYQDNVNNAIASGTLAAGASATVPLATTLVNGEQILALASQGGVVQLEVDGILNQADPNTQILEMLVFMLGQLGLDLPNQGAVNAGAITF